MKKGFDEIDRVTTEAAENIELFRPFIFENAYVFRADNIRALRDRMPAEDQAKLTWGPEKLDLYDYWMNIHFPGLARWVLPELDETYALEAEAGLQLPRPARAVRHDDQAARHAHRAAHRARQARGDLQLRRSAGAGLARGRSFSSARAWPAGERVMLWAKNCPEWSMAYFGVLKAAATVVPVDRELEGRRAGERRARLGRRRHPHRRRSPRQGRRGAGARPSPRRACRPSSGRSRRRSRSPTWRSSSERGAKLARRASPDALASLIFTSGTTGKPKGVMLTHRNFTFMVSELSKIFEFGVNDGMLSVLPLHHTFEFATGLLVPLSHGAQVTYLTELTGDAISVDAQAGAGHRHRRRARRCGISCAGACSSASPTSRRCLEGVHEGAGGGELRAALAHRVRPRACSSSCPCTKGSAGASATSSAAARRCRPT